MVIIPLLLLVVILIILVFILLSHSGPLGLISAAGHRTQLGHVLDQASDLELLGHGEEPGDVRGGHRHLAIIHEVNNT